MTTHSVTTERSAEIAALCRELGVKRLEFVGAVTTAEFNPETDFVKIIVEFLPGAERPWMAEYSGLFEGLEALYGTEVLSVGGRGPALDDPEYREWVESTRTVVYEV